MNDEFERENMVSSKAIFDISKTVHPLHSSFEDADYMQKLVVGPHLKDATTAPVNWRRPLLFTSLLHVPSPALLICSTTKVQRLSSKSLTHRGPAVRTWKTKGCQLMNIYEWICTDFKWVAAPELVTALIIACDIEPFIPIAIGTTEGHDVSIDASEGDCESKKSSGETHDMFKLVIPTSSSVHTWMAKWKLNFTCI